MPGKKEQIANSFFALLKDESVKKITLLQSVTSDIRDIFMTASSYLKNNVTEEIEFDGNYNIQEEEVLYVNFNLPEDFLSSILNPIGITNLNLDEDLVKALFWIEKKSNGSNVIYFQNFDNRKVLKNKNILTFNTNSYSKLEANAFIIDDTVSVIFDNGKLYFKSFNNANKIFNLSSYYEEATNEEIETFSANPKVDIDTLWFQENSNTLIRKQVTLIQKSKILDTADVLKIESNAKDFKLEIEIKGGKIKFPNDKKQCKGILSYLNEQYYIGLITGNKFKTNSHKPVL
jgi:hypothetical protein